MEDITFEIADAIRDNNDLLCEYDTVTHEMSFMINLLKLNKDNGNFDMIDCTVNNLRLLTDRLSEIVQIRAEMINHVNSRALQRTLTFDGNNSSNRHNEEANTEANIEANTEANTENGPAELFFDLTTTSETHVGEEVNNLSTPVSLYSMVMANQSSHENNSEQTNEQTSEQTRGNSNALLHDLTAERLTDDGNQLPSGNDSESQNQVQDLSQQNNSYQRYSIFNNVDANTEVTNDVNVPPDIEDTVVTNRQQYSNYNNALEDNSSSDDESYDNSDINSFDDRLLTDIDLTDPYNARLDGYYIKRRPKLKSKFVSKKIECVKTTCIICSDDFKPTDMVTFGSANENNKIVNCHSFCLNCSLSTMRAGFANAPFDRFHHCPLCRVNIDSVEFSYTRDEGDSKSVLQTDKVRPLRAFCGKRCINI